MKIEEIYKVSMKGHCLYQVSNPEILKRPGLIIETIELTLKYGFIRNGVIFVVLMDCLVVQKQLPFFSYKTRDF